jgi:hypothetical protein
MNRNLPYVLLAILAGVVVYGLTESYRRGHEDGMADVASRQVADRVRIVRQVDSVYVRDTVRLARWRDRWDSVRVTDTVVVADIVYVPRDAADSTISACYAVIRSCEARVAARDSLAASLQGALQAERAARPSALRVGVDRALWAAAGLAAGMVLSR